MIIIYTTPGSKAFFESIAIPNAIIKNVHGSMGKVYVSLLVDTHVDPDIVCHQYLMACANQVPIGQEIIVSAEN